MPDFGSFMSDVFPEPRGVAEVSLGVSTTGRAQPPQRLRRDFEAALNLLQRASDAFPALLSYCQQLETDLRRQRSETDSAVRTANGEAQQWQQVAVAMKMHIEESDHQLAVMRKRLAVAEERLAAGENLAAAAEQRASVAIGITNMFHDKIIDAFGIGSAAHSALDATPQAALRGPMQASREKN